MKVFLQTYGCRANHYDTEAVRGMLEQAGVEEVADASVADFAVFNSCSVTSAAEADLRAGVRQAARLNPSIRTIVMGCASGVTRRDESRTPLATLPSVESIVVGGDVAAVGSALGVALAKNSTPSVQTGARALLRIQDGCDEHCTFCVTTNARGENRSRSADEIVDEAKRLSETHPEIVVTGIHIGSYGNDIGSSLGELVERLVAETDSVRFRLTSIEATEVDERLADLLTADSTRVAPHLHAPLQSGSDRVLKRMGRHWYTATTYAESVEALVGNREVFALSGDVICGFPGETEDDHRATIELVQSLPFTALHVFPYSPRPGTAALRLSGTVPSSIASRRAAELRALAAEKSAQYAAKQNGRVADVVVIGRRAGLTEDYLSVSISNQGIARRERFNATLSLEGGRLSAATVTSAAE
jgi:threonylcarbamoyladenosine tRNA methylthiotransferase MtaB